MKTIYLVDDLYEQVVAMFETRKEAESFCKANAISPHNLTEVLLGGFAWRRYEDTPIERMDAYKRDEGIFFIVSVNSSKPKRFCVIVNAPTKAEAWRKTKPYLKKVYEHLKETDQ